MTQRTMFLAFIVIPMSVAATLALAQFFLTRSILRIVKEVAPGVAKKLAVHTGVSLIDETLWVRPRRFVAFTKSGDSFGDERLERRLRQYKWSYYVSVCLAAYFLLLLVFMFVLFVRTSG